MVFGMTGSGKTTFAFRYLLNVSAACRFIFDDKGQAAARLRVSHASTALECERALEKRWVVFNPLRMFPGDTAAAFRWFCQWTYDVSRRGSGKKVLLVDEVWQWCNPNGIPKELALVAQAGRAENLELVVASQMPHKIHSSVSGQATELVCFRLQERLALDAVEGSGADRETVESLPLGSFVSWNRLSGVDLAGRLF
jgi:DNA helicase HerA-like ATPase